MTRRDSTLRSGVGLALALGLGGCLERSERITVEPDGTVGIEILFKTESFEELHRAGTAPALAGGWLTEEWVEEDEEGEKRYLLRAETLLGADMPLPANFAVPGDSRSGEYLQFPTAITIEDRPDGIYYHFHRIYPAREWARIQELRELLLEEKLKVLKDKEHEELTRADHMLVIGAYADFEVAEMLAFARRAHLELSPDAPQDGWLGVHSAISGMKAKLRTDRVASLLEIQEKDERDAAIKDETERWEADAFKLLKTSMREFCGYTGSRLRAFTEHYESQRRELQITGDLGDDSFQITVVMPGEIVGTNADSISHREAKWTFSGERFRDRDLELMVSSRLDRDP